MSGARQFSLKWQNPAARVPLREIVFADASPQTPGEHHHRSASPENGLSQDVLKPARDHRSPPPIGEPDLDGFA
jgi:hypothetical protein